MASRPKGYGLTADVRRKIDGKYDLDLEREAREWIEALTGEELKSGEGMENFHKDMKDGVLLCKVANVLVPGGVKKINTGNLAFKQMENIGKFLEAIDAYGVSKTDSFQTVDLYEKQNMANVVLTIHALGRKAQSKGFAGAVLGVKESNANKREFTDEQMAAGKGIIGLQMGSNKGASQAGQNFGKQRMIID